MCGIFGLMMYPKQRNEKELTFIRELASELAIQNQARGSHATGIATFGKDGYDVLKHNISAEELTTYDTWIDFLEKNINNDTYNILGHTRYATQGLPTNNDNNHPIVTATNIGVHNGMIYNDDRLFEKENLFRQAEVDSEAIFRLIDKQVVNNKESSKAVAEKLGGVYAVAYVKKEDRNILNYFRNSNPTTFAYIPELNILVFASIKTYIEEAMVSASESLRYFLGSDIKLGEVHYFSPKENITMQFDVTDNTPMEQLYQEPLRFVDSYDYGYNYYGAWNDDEDWYTDFRTRGNSSSSSYSANDDTNDYTSVYDFIDKKGLQYLMSDEDFDSLVELLDLSEKNEWSKGYQAGRSSLDNDIKLIKEQKEITNKIKSN